MTKIINPILKGFHPDPCLCKANGIYYLITSTFEWTPGVSLYESEDLIHWNYKGGMLDKLELIGVPDSAGVWAPALTYDNGIFYLIFTISKQIDGYFKDVENFVITASSIDGPWSEPKFINASGFDPSMFHEDGKHYILNPQWDYRPLDGHRKFNGLILQEFDFEKGMVNESEVVFKGSQTGGTEGPHLIKKDDYYYIIAAEGGTGRHHSIVVARSTNIWGPYEISPYHPLITSWEKDTLLKKSGHGNFIEANNGDWYMCHLCARYLTHKEVSILGRETSLQRIEWIDGWPKMIQGDNTPQLEIDISHQSHNYELSNIYRTDFQKDTLIQDEWLSLRTSFHQKVKFVNEGLKLQGNDSLTSLFHQSLIARRFSSFDFETKTNLIFEPYHYSQTAGLVCYYNTKVFHYLYVGYDEIKKQRIINILTNDNLEFNEPLQGQYIYVPQNTNEIQLKVIVCQENLQFMYSFDNEHFNNIGPILDTSILSDEHALGWAYTGAMVGITAVDNFNKDTSAIFTYFEQINNEG